MKHLMTTNSYNLARFIEAQEYNYPNALQEIRDSRKTSHWIWFIYPQMKGLGRSYNSQYYGISFLEEARAYLAHPLLGMRLREITHALLTHKSESADKILGHIEALKVRSCMTLFDIIEPNTIFAEVLDSFYEGTRDNRTLQLTNN